MKRRAAQQRHPIVTESRYGDAWCAEASSETVRPRQTTTLQQQKKNNAKEQKNNQNDERKKDNTILLFFVVYFMFVVSLLFALGGDIRRQTDDGRTDPIGDYFYSI